LNRFLPVRRAADGAPISGPIGIGNYRDGARVANHSLIVPFYMLIGFSLENALKAVLEFNGSDSGTKWSHSHDLQKLRLLAEHHDFILSDDLREFVDHLSPLHKDHHFRYPQKAETAHLLKPIAATELTERLLVEAFLAIDGAKRMDDRSA
jgi:hypothetical protein